MKHAYSYIRFSSPEQAKGDSFRRQSEKAAAWAAKNGYQIVEVLADLGVSAYRGKNVKEGRLGAFLSLVDAGEIEPGSVLLVESLDRFSRNTVREVLPDVINEGIGVVTLADERLYTKESLDKDNFQLLTSLIVMTRAHEESQRKGERVAEAWAEKRGRAREESEKITDRIPAWLNVNGEGRGKNKKRTLVANPIRAAVVQRIFDETVQGYGRREIAKRLNREVREGQTEFSSFGTKKVPGSEEVKKDNWQPSYIAKIIRGRAVLGEYQPHKRNDEGKREEDGDVIKNYYPATIDEALWLRANAATTDRKTGDANGRPQAEAVNLIGSLARCDCGARMAFLNKGQPPKGGRYYVCSSADREAGCRNGRYWKWETVEKAIFYHLDKAVLEHAFKPSTDPVGQSPQQSSVQRHVRHDL